jgi:malonyl-CoA O-methyltransferase
MDIEVLTMTYASLDDLFRDVRQSGAACAMQARRQGLMGRSAWQSMRVAYEALKQEGRLPATFEVIYGHAWKTQPKKIEDGRAIIRFDSKRAR